jgi:hypothetical protein
MPRRGDVSGLTFWPIMLKHPHLEAEVEVLPAMMRPRWYRRRRINAPWAAAYFDPEAGMRVYPDVADARDQADEVLTQ